MIISITCYSRPTSVNSLNICLIGKALTGSLMDERKQVRSGEINYQYVFS